MEYPGVEEVKPEQHTWSTAGSGGNAEAGVVRGRFPFGCPCCIGVILVLIDE